MKRIKETGKLTTYTLTRVVEIEHSVDLSVPSLCSQIAIDRLIDSCTLSLPFVNDILELFQSFPRVIVDVTGCSEKKEIDECYFDRMK